MAGEDLNVIIGVFVDDQATQALQSLPAEVQTAVQRVNAELTTLGNVDSFTGASASAATLQERLAGITAASAEATAQLLLAAEAGRGLNAAGIQPRITGIAEAQQLLGILASELKVRQEIAATGLGAGVRRTEGGQLRSEVDGRDTRISVAENERLLAINAEELAVLKAQSEEFSRAYTQLSRVRTESQEILTIQERIALAYQGQELSVARLLTAGAARNTNAEIGAAAGGLPASRVGEIRAEIAAMEVQREAIRGVTASTDEETQAFLRNTKAATDAAIESRVGANRPLGTTSEVADREALAADKVAQAKAILLQLDRQEITGEEEVAAARAQANTLMIESAAITSDLTAAKKESAAAYAEETAFVERLSGVTQVLAEETGALLRAKLALIAADERVAQIEANSAAGPIAVANAYRQQSAAADGLAAAELKLAAAEKEQAAAARTAALGGGGAAGAGGGGGGFFGGLSEGLSGKGGFDAESAGRQVGEVAKYIYLYEAFIKLSEGIKEAIKNTEEFERSVTNLQTILGGTREDARSTGEQLAAIGAVGGLTPAASTNAGLQFARTFQGQAGQGELLNQGAEQATKLQVLTGKDGSEQLQDATAAVRGFNLSFSDTNRVIDAATFAAQKFGFANASDVLPGLGQIADIASAAGFSVEKTAALVADVRARTGETSEAAAGELRRVFGRQGNNAFQQVFTAFGIDRTQGLDKEIEQLAGKFDTLNTKQRAFIASTFGGGRAGTAVTAFLEDYPKIADTAAGALDHAGISQQQFFKRINDVAGIITTIRGEFARLGVALGESGIAAPLGGLLIGLKDVLTAAGNILQVFNALPEPLRQGVFLAGELLLAGKALAGLGIGTKFGADFRGVGAGREARLAENATLTGFTSTGFAAEEVKDQSAAVSKAVSAAGKELVTALEGVTAALAAAEGETTAELTAARAALSDALLGLSEEEATRVASERVAARNIAAGGAATAQALQAAAAEIKIAGEEIAGAGAVGAGEDLLARSGQLSRGAGRVAAEEGLLAETTRTGAAKEAALGLGAGLKSLFTSPLFLGILGLTAGSAIISDIGASQSANLAVTQAQQLTGGGPPTKDGLGGLTSEGSLDSAISAAGNARQKVADANGHVFNEIAGLFSSSGEDALKRADAVVQLFKDQKKQFDIARKALAQGANPSSIIDFSIEGGVKTGVQTLEQSGRSATTVFQSLVDGLAALNTQATAAANGGLAILPQTLAKTATDLARAVGGAAADANIALHKLTLNDFRGEDGGSAEKKVARESRDKAFFNNLDQTKFTSALDTAFQKDLADLGITDSGGTLSAAQVEELRKRSLDDALAVSKAQGFDVSKQDKHVQDAFKAAADARFQSVLKALQGEGDAQKGLITPDNINQAIADAGKNASAAGTEAGNAAALAGTGGAAFTAAATTKQFLESALAQARKLQQDHPELVSDGQLEQLQNLVNAADLAYVSQQQTHLDLLAKLSESALAPSDKIDRAAIQAKAIADKLKIETDPDKIAALQTAQNDLLHQQAQNAVDRANAVEKSSIDPRDVVGVAQAAVDAAVRQINLLKSEGDTSSAAFFDALAQLQAGEVALAQQRVSAANAAIEAGVASGDSLGEANAKVQEAINNLNATIAGTPARDQAIRALHDAQFAAAQAAAAQANAQAEANILPGDVYREAHDKVTEARRDLAATSVGTTEYYKALRAYEDALVAFAQQQRDAAKTAFLLASGTFSDPLTQAQADIAGAAAKLAADRKGVTFTTPDTIIKGTPGTAAVGPSQASLQRAAAAQAAVNSDNAQIASLRQQEADQLAFLRGTGTASNPQFGGAQNYIEQKKAFEDVIGPLQQKLNQDTAELNAANTAAQGTPGTAGTPDRVIRGVTKTIKASAQQIQADLLALEQAQLAAAQAAAAFENAKIEANEGDVSSKVDAARNALVEATNTLKADQQNSTKYFQDLTALHRAQEAYAQALRDAARTSDELSGDTTDPVFEANVALRAARAKLAQDIARKASKDTINTDKLDVTKATEAAQKSLFDQQFSDNQTAFNLREESAAQYLQFLKGQDTSLRKQLAAMKKGSEGYRQLVDELNQVDQAIQAANSQLAGQFNLGDIKLPTVYEVRRSVAASANGQNVTSSNVQNIQTTINGADFAKVVAYINSVLTPSSQTVAQTGRKVA